MMSSNEITSLGWELLYHGGLLVDVPRLQKLSENAPLYVTSRTIDEWRRRYTSFKNDKHQTGEWVAWVLEHVCDFTESTGRWLRGSSVGKEWTHHSLTGEAVRPRHVWQGMHDVTLPVFIDEDNSQLGKGRGRKTVSNVLQWMRATNHRLALLTNGRQWRLMYAGLDSEAFCEWDADLWFEEGGLGLQVKSFRLFFNPTVWLQKTAEQPGILVQAIQDSRKGQAELSAHLGERIREAVEILVRAHGAQLQERCADVDPADMYRAAVRVVMRMVVILFAESRDLLPRSNSLYHRCYGLAGLLTELEKYGGKNGQRLGKTHAAWPRILALCKMVHDGVPHPAMTIHAYGGSLFEPGDLSSHDGVKRALAVFETACFDAQIMNDRDVYTLLEHISRTRVKVRQGRSATWIPVPVDFADLSSEYIGILYEGLLDFELKTALEGDPVIFLAVGNQPALPLSRLEAMDDKALKALLETMKDTSSKDDDGGDATDIEETDDAGESVEILDADDETVEIDDDSAVPQEVESEDERHTTRFRAEQWARRAVEVGKLVKKPGGNATTEQLRAYTETVARKARQLVTRVVLPGEWYLVRWGGTRKGSGTFYTRPGLAVPTIQRTLRPLAFNPPSKPDGTPDTNAPSHAWTPKLPEEILSLKTCDPACGSGTFPVGALRYLTEALYAAVHYHGRIIDQDGRSVVSLLGIAREDQGEVAALGQEMVPCRPGEENFEPRLKAVLKRHVVERCIYGVDLDPLAVELCRLALWIETMDRSLPFSYLDHKIKCGNGLVGAWFDQFLHYPVMAWKNREGGDKGHTNGVHYAKDIRGKALKEFASGRLKDDLKQFLSGPTLFNATDRAQEAGAVHADALALLSRLHELPVQDAAERARMYREELLASSAYQQLKSAMDLWCACWFWSADALDVAPLPTTFAQPSEETAAEAALIAARLRFFHWELEFPDVFHVSGSGFDCILGNPPWDVAKPNSKEFFSNIDPLYRTYGKQEALRIQSACFEQEILEQRWLEYNSDFRAQSNFIKYAAQPYGDPIVANGSDRYGIAKGKDNDALHSRWRSLRSKTGGYADSAHSFRYQGSADINLYKTFLEQAHALLRFGGRMGFIIPSGLYSDHGTGVLRRHFLDNCQWEWLFGFENRDGIFEIHRSFKFNPIIIQKGGSTAAINTAFMRRKLEDWERAEDYATPYTRAQIDQFSPKSQAILEIQSKRDLEILEKIYANSVLLGDDGPDGWGVRYAREFDMTNHSKLFPPRVKWEVQGYRPDEYSRWLKGDWRPITELWSELGIDPTKVVPSTIDLEEWLFETTASPERRAAEAKFVHGHVLKPGDVARTSWRLRCAQPPYDTLPIPRADIPPGIILSRIGDAYMHEDKIQDVALPLYEGKDIWIHDWSYITEEGSSTSVRRPLPNFLMRFSDWPDSNDHGTRLVFRDISNATNARSFISSIIPHRPCGNGVPVLRLTQVSRSAQPLLCAWFSSIVFDWSVRQRMSGTHLNWHIAESLGIPRPGSLSMLLSLCQRVDYSSLVFSPEWLGVEQTARPSFELTPSERIRHLITLDSCISSWLEVGLHDLEYVLSGSDQPRPIRNGASKGFWRVDKDKHPELRHTVLTLIAFHDLEQKIREHDGDRDKGIKAFLNQNNGDGWLVPETVRLADYGLGHDERAQQHQPVASRLGPRFYDWQLTQTAEESWRECHLHARNMLGEHGYRQLLERIEAEKRGEVWQDPSASKTEKVESQSSDNGQLGMEL